MVKTTTKTTAATEQPTRMTYAQKMAKWVGVVIEPSSNKYLKITGILPEYAGKVFWMGLQKYHTFMAKSGKCWVLKPMNWPEDQKPIFVAPWACVTNNENYYLPPFIIFKSDDPLVAQIAQGCDDLEPLENLLERFNNAIPIKIREKNPAEIVF